MKSQRHHSISNTSFFTKFDNDKYTRYAHRNRSTPDMETSEAFPDNKTNLADPAKLAEENPKSCHRSTRGQIGNLGTLQNQIHLGFPVSVLLDGSPAKVYLSHWRDLLEESCFHKPLNRQSKSHAGAKIQKKERREKKKYIRCSIKAISEFQKFSLSN